jgi:hypothetical protein
MPPAIITQGKNSVGRSSITYQFPAMQRQNAIFQASRPAQQDRGVLPPMTGNNKGQKVPDKTMGIRKKTNDRQQQGTISPGQHNGDL